MARRISGITDLLALGAAIDSELSRLETMTKSGAVSKNVLASKADSYLFIDHGILKFFNATDKTTKTVTVV
jgi:hypothetical protein